MLDPFATASRRTPPVLILHCHSPGVATVDTTTKVSRRRRATVATPDEWQCKIDVHNDNNDNAWQRGPLWTHRMGPINKHEITAMTGGLDSWASNSQNFGNAVCRRSHRRRFHRRWSACELESRSCHTMYMPSSEWFRHTLRTHATWPLISSIFSRRRARFPVSVE